MAEQKPTIKFGTDGWRGIIADDFTGANVRLVAQAVVNYFKRTDVPGEPIVFIGYDNRSQSEYFGLEAAKVVAAAGLKAVIIRTARVLLHPCHLMPIKPARRGGIMITRLA